jgi:alpha-1,3-rhamnosyl/mannosyltransferase
MPGFVCEESLPALMAGASLFAYPSREEGFGFPPLEAMACGVPVVATRTSSLEENLVGSAALVPVGDAIALANELKRVLRDETERERMRESGLERASQFQWSRTAEQTLVVYEGG